MFSLIWGRNSFWSCKLSNYKSWRLYRDCTLNLVWFSCKLCTELPFKWWVWHSPEGLGGESPSSYPGPWWERSPRCWGTVFWEREGPPRKAEGEAPHGWLSCALRPVHHAGRLVWCKSRAGRGWAEVWVPRRRPQDQDGLSLGRGLSLSHSGKKSFRRWDLKSISLPQVPLSGSFLFFSALMLVFCFVLRMAFCTPC